MFGWFNPQMICGSNHHPGNQIFPGEVHSIRKNRANKRKEHYNSDPFNAYELGSQPVRVMFRGASKTTDFHWHSSMNRSVLCVTAGSYGRCASNNPRFGKNWLAGVGIARSTRKPKPSSSDCSSLAVFTGTPHISCTIFFREASRFSAC